MSIHWMLLGNWGVMPLNDRREEPQGFPPVIYPKSDVVVCWRCGTLFPDNERCPEGCNSDSQSGYREELLLRQEQAREKHRKRLAEVRAKAKSTKAGQSPDCLCDSCIGRRKAKRKVKHAQCAVQPVSRFGMRYRINEELRFIKGFRPRVGCNCGACAKFNNRLAELSVD